MPIDPIAALASEWTIPPVDSPIPSAGGQGFGQLLGDQMKQLELTQTEAAQQARDLATGEATDSTAVVMAVERAQLAMQLASQVRTKSVEALQTIFSTQV